MIPGAIFGALLMLLALVGVVKLLCSLRFPPDNWEGDDEWKR